MPGLRRILWRAAALLAGAISMALEIAAARLIAPALGASIEVWGTLISSILAAMALGAMLGGRVADRAKDDRPMFWAILASGALQAIALFIAPSLTATLPNHSEVGGTLLAIGALFALPTLLLAGVAPYAIRLSAKTEVGTTAGAIYALATIGSIGGVLLTTFALLPELGTRATLIALAATTIALGVIGLATARGFVAAASAIALLFAAPAPKMPPHTIWSGESLYHTVQVIELGAKRGLVLDQAADLHTLIDPRGGPSEGYWDELGLGPLLTGREAGHRSLVLGMGAGASIRATLRTDPSASIDAVELDPLVVEAAAKYFDVHASANLRIHTADARRFLATSNDRWDVIQADLFRGGPDIPEHLATVEFYALVGAHLAPHGVFLLNVFDLARDHAVLNAILATLHEAFPTLMVRTREANHIIFAFDEPRALDDVRNALRSTNAASAEALDLAHSDPSTPVLTDDRTHLAQLTHRMFTEAPMR